MMATLSPTAGAGDTPPEKPRNGAETAPEAAAPLIAPDSSLLRDVSVTLEARLGQAVMPVSELLDLRHGSVLRLEAALNEPVELYLNGALVARGDIVAVDDKFGVRIVEIAAK